MESKLLVFSALPYRSFIKNRIDFIVDELIDDFEIFYFEKPIFFDFSKIEGMVSKLKGDFRINHGRTRYNFIQVSFKKLFLNIKRVFGLKLRIGRVHLFGQTAVFSFLSNKFPCFEKLDFTIRHIVISKHLQRIREIGEGGKCIALVCHPWWSNILHRNDFDLFCYDCSDDMANYSINPKYLGKMVEWHAKTIKISDRIFTSSSKIASDVLKHKPSAKIDIIPNGVNSIWFYDQANRMPMPDDISRINGFRIGYVGNIIFPWLDIEMIRAVAIKRPDFNIILIGWIINPKMVEGLRGISNIFLLGGKDYSIIPSYMKAFDVCLAPFKVGEALNSSDPLIIYEYLSLGKPIVASRIREMLKYNRLVYFYDDTKSLIEGIHKSLNENDETLRNERIAISRNNTWEKRADIMKHQMTKIERV